jgi:hypothetical protein
MAYLLCALLIQAGVLDLTGVGGLKEVINSLGVNAVVALLLAAAGIRMVGQGAGLENWWTWLVLVIVSLPVVAFVWFVSYATLGGAMGSPF